MESGHDASFFLVWNFTSKHHKNIKKSQKAQNHREIKNQQQSFIISWMFSDC